ncbi:MAG: MXAN_6640 family putative metalloprotease [Actinomycetes bacterium]
MTALALGGSLAAAAPLGATAPSATAPSATAPSTTAPAPARDRLTAPALLARPNAGKVELGRNMSWGVGKAPESPACHPTKPLCVHWTDKGDHAVPPADSDADGIPNQVERTLAAVTTSWTAIVGTLGFRKPLPDGRSTVNGGDNRFDVYLADTGKADLSGYTSSDDPRLADGSSYRYRDASAFIVLDNDYRPGQFTGSTPEDHLRVAAAHEFFHAVQFAYDYREDVWMTEGTAAWVEDRVFDDVNLNRQYLQHSPLSAPLTPLDFGRQGHEYGSWLFFRYLTERFGAKIIARIWRLADDSADQVSNKASMTYSMRAVRRAIAREGSDFAKVYTQFIMTNLRPAKGYSEGATYPVPFVPRIVLGPKGQTTGWLGTKLSHLSAIYVAYVPGQNAPPARRLLLGVDGPPRGSAPAARALIRFDGGRVKTVPIKLNRRGNGEVKVPFGRSSVSSVTIALINGSTRYTRCSTKTAPFSCGGRSKDDERFYKVRAKVL